MRLDPRPATAAPPSAAAYRDVRRLTLALGEPLAVEDYGVQSMPDASPTKWHLAHTSWFFETFVLAAFRRDYAPFDARYKYLFNSYYNAVGERLPRERRGVISRPTVEEVFRYRAHVDSHVLELPHEDSRPAELDAVVVLGLNHEQQHQELILTDLKHALGLNPLRPAYRERAPGPAPAAAPVEWLTYPAGVRWIGHEGEAFAFDNETPRHRVFVDAFRLADRLTTCAEYLAFMEAGGYDRPEWWLSDGWAARQAQGWVAPLYWEKPGGEWVQYTLDGVRPVRPGDPVCHVSYYEADAFARWSGARLPTEAEWETAAQDCHLSGSFLDAGRLHPAPAAPSESGGPPAQMFGEAWQWTASPYVAYPGYRPAAGALGEYNGKFMCNQMVLRGGSCATPLSHFRRSYRNFFPPDARWQFTGIRLASHP
jgi:ergothioneine biosynthesis protein EgtB